MNSLLFFFNDTATTEIYTLSLHDALPILRAEGIQTICCIPLTNRARTFGTLNLASRSTDGFSAKRPRPVRDRKSTRLNSSHQIISYAVFCLKKKTDAHTPLPAATLTPPVP